MKGVSPVVAIVMLIAISVIATVSVWFWINPMTGKPATADTTQKTVSVEQCYAQTNALRLRNSGGYAITNQLFEVYMSSTGNPIGVNVTVDSLNPGESDMFNASGLTPGIQYFLRATGYPDSVFSC
jgi:FlaG/FlaF family flagellin (archaellin)